MSTKNAKSPEEMDIKDEVRKLSIPLTNMIPAPHRAFVYTMSLKEIQLAEGLIVPGATIVKDHNKNNLTIQRKRYFIVAIGKDFSVKDLDGKSLEPGDEVMLIDYDDKSILHLPEVTDYENGMTKFSVVDELEIVAFRRAVRVEKVLE